MPFSCFLFRPRKSRERRRKRSHTNASNASVTRTSRVSQTPLQTPIPYFHQWVPHGKKALVAIVYKWPTFTFVHESGYIHSPLPIRSHTSAHTAKHGASRMGALLLPSERSTRFENSAWPGLKTANLAAFGSWLDVLPKNAESLRDSDALMRVAVPKASRPRRAA